MGGTQAAGAAGADAMFLNPAGLSRLDPRSPWDMGLGYSNLLETSYAGSAALARSLGESGVLGAGLVYFSQSSLTAYNSVGDAAGNFTPYDMAVNVSYARPLGPVLAGGNLKMIHSSLAEASGTTAAIDLGVQALHVGDVGSGAVDLGGGVSNLGPPLTLGSVASPLPLSLRGGFLWHTTPMVNSALDVVLPVDQDPYVSLGLEAGLKQGSWKGFARLGFNQSHTRDIDGFSGFTAGVGLDAGSFRLDYAWAPYGDLGSTNRVALGFRF